MSFFKFLTSKVFLKQIALALVIVVVLAYVILQWLKVTTNHGEYITVPDLSGLSLETAQIQLKDLNLKLEVQDSANYNPNYPKYAVIEQYPLVGSSVKRDRKIYLILNPSDYRKVLVPNVIRRTYRQAKPTLESLGFEIGKIIYEDDLGKDEVLEISYKGDKLSAGDLLPLTSKIDIVLGNGTRKGSDSQSQNSQLAEDNQ
ncbi:PASTA domain-containing protein [Paucihalobacter ruber]|uniref:PASTA domain-containing protein n=1 Tax=Paucihalobacter ruber TaxID=2567861 RepID=A0A506PK80_9FLAO|nr:PASTA domain-containing protein [Paucihalobacter ruber]TPV34019.1 PASTA domain-containing protein [Paucihalobacter ruber]